VNWVIIVVPILTSKIRNQDIGASQYRAGCSREYAERSIRRSAQPASIGVFVPRRSPVEAAPFRKWRSQRSAEIVGLIRLLSAFARLKLARWNIRFSRWLAKTGAGLLL